MALPLVGIFVGGRGSRMGGVAKGLLQTDGEPLVLRLARVGRAALGDTELVLVGAADAYRELGLESLPDDPPAVGPLGGLAALLAEGTRRGSPFVLTLACDLPFVSSNLLVRLARHEPEASAVAPKQQGRWQPLCARYDPSRALAAARAVLARGDRALFRVLDELGAVELPLAPGDDLTDWDEPSDLA